jgi:AcrR family transcriptional regulator
LDRGSFYLMGSPVKPEPRPYDNASRLRSSRTRQVRVAEITARLLVERGYAATTMADIATAAGVSIPWLYKVFGPKPKLVKRTYDVLLAGDPDPLPMSQRPAFVALAAETDPRRAVDRYAAIARELSSRAGPLAASLLAAADNGDPDLAELAATMKRERLMGATAFTDHLARLAALRPDRAPEEARDTVWTLISPEVYRLLVLDCGWTDDRYEQWLAESLTGSLLHSRP